MRMKRSQKEPHFAPFNVPCICKEAPAASKGCLLRCSSQCNSPKNGLASWDSLCPTTVVFISPVEKFPEMLLDFCKFATGLLKILFVYHIMIRQSDPLLLHYDKAYLV